METISDIIAEMESLGDKWTADPGRTTIECMGLIIWHLARRLKAAWEREKPVGNAAAMREAMQKVEESAAEIMERVRHKSGLAFNTANYIAGIAKAALALPPRQCDIGTAEEQAGRHCSMCIAITKNGTKECDYSKCNSCFAEWAQMPYAADEKGDGDGR